MNLSQLTFLWIFCTRISIKSANVMDNIQIKKTFQPGLYFERLQNVKFAQSYARLVIFIDFQLSRSNVTTFERIFANLHDSCDLSENECLLYNVKIQKLRREFEEVYSYFDMIIGSYKNMDATLPEEVLMEYNIEAELFDRNRDDAILNLNNEAIMLESTLSRISSSRVRENEKLYGYLDSIREMAFSHMDYSGTLDFANDLMRKELLHVRRNARLLINSINAIKGNKLLPSLLDNYNWQKAIRYIEDLYTPNRFPEIKKGMELEALDGLITFRYGVWQNKVFVEAKVPLVNNVSLALYEVKILPAPQEVYGQMPGMIYILPESRHMLATNQTYYNIQERELQLCKNIGENTLCPKQWFTLSNHSNCEHSLLFNAAEMDFRTCNIKYENSHKPNFIRINTTENWLFVVPKPINVTIGCLRNKEVVTEINGTGLLGSTSDCTLKYKDNQLRISTPIRNSTKRLILPEVNLNITKLTTIFDDVKAIIIFKELTSRKSEYSFWELERICKNLSTEQSKYSNLVVLVVILFIILILVLSIVLSIITFMYYFKNILQETPDEIEIGIREEIERDPARGLTTRAVLRFV